MQWLRSSRASSVLLAVLAMVAILALTLGAAGIARANTVSVLPVTSQQTGISVCGHGTATSKPTRAQIQVGVQARAATAEEARSQAASAMNGVLAALKNNGLAEQDIQTAYFSIQPNYTYGPNGAMPNGYIASNSVTATVRAVDSVGKVADAVTVAGGNNVVLNGIQFFGNDGAQQDEAQRNALADARHQAERIASGAGVSLGAPISIQSGACAPATRPYYNAYDAAGVATTKAPSTPIQPGQVAVDAYVAVVYAIR